MIPAHLRRHPGRRVVGYSLWVFIVAFASFEPGHSKLAYVANIAAVGLVAVLLGAVVLPMAGRVVARRADRVGQTCGGPEATSDER